MTANNLNYRCSDLAAWAGGRLLGPDTHITGVSIDSRTTRRGDLFFALSGEHADGHAYAEAALRAGAAAAVVDAARLPDGAGRRGTLIAVPDPLAALGRLATCHRERHRVITVGVTGSLGKTTTKDMLAAVLSRRFRTLANQGNLRHRPTVSCIRWVQVPRDRQPSVASGSP